jgi:hypothetical protein
VSCLRRAISSAACFTMRDSDSFSTLLCHDVDTRAAFARARLAYSLGRSLLKFRPVVRTGSISVGRGEWFAESPFMPLVSAIVPRRCRSVFVVSYALSNAIFELRVSYMETVDQAQVVQIVHLLRLAGCDAVAADLHEL